MDLGSFTCQFRTINLEKGGRLLCFVLFPLPFYLEVEEGVSVILLLKLSIKQRVLIKLLFAFATAHLLPLTPSECV